MVAEGLHLDFKAGAWAGKQFDRELRRYVAGFANASGGVLVLGVGEPERNEGHQTSDRPIKPVPMGHRDATNDEIHRALHPIAAFLVPPPKIVRVPVEGGEVILVAIERALGLVTVIEGGTTPTYYFRFGESTIDAPNYLVEDLLVGRRQRPVLVVELARPKPEVIRWGPAGDESISRLVTIRNESPLWVDQPQIGLVGMWQGATQRLTPALASQIDLRPSASDTRAEHHLYPVRVADEQPAIRPFHHWQVGLPGRPHIGGGQGLILLWRGALYVIGRGTPPQWFQIVFLVAPDSGGMGSLVFQEVWPTGNQRPEVGMNYTMRGGRGWGPNAPEQEWTDAITSFVQRGCTGTLRPAS